MFSDTELPRPIMNNRRN